MIDNSISELNSLENEDDEFYDDWTPPSEEEMAEIMRQRARTDKATSKMGERLLQGWKLLAEMCPVIDCNMPLMSDKEGVVCRNNTHL